MDKTYLVTKSNYFIMNCNYDLSLEEQKIILTLASMVQPEDEDFKQYKFKIADFMELLGIKDKSKYIEIPKITKELMKKVFEIHEGKKLIQTAWLSGVVYEKGTGYVELTFSSHLKPYMLKLNSLFTQYKLANILSMKSKYSPRIYEILKCNEFKKQGFIEIEIEELRNLLKAEHVYPKYNDFKRYVVERTQKELNKISDISFEFEEIKTGRKVTSIKFIIKSNRKTIDKHHSNDDKNVHKEEYDEDLIKKVKDIFEEKITDFEAQTIFNAANDDLNKISEKYEISKTISKINNLVGWIVDAIKKDYQPPKEKVKPSTFNSFEQRKYDFDDLERKLLGWDKQ